MMQRKQIILNRPDLAGRTVYWAVQTIDTGLAKSAWSAEQTYVIAGCTESWSYGEWGACSNGLQYRSATDVNNCGTFANRSATNQSCTVTPSGNGGSPGTSSSGNPMRDPINYSTTEVKKWPQIQVNETAVFEVNRTDIEVERIEVRVSAVVTGAEIRVRRMDEKPEELQRPSGNVYSYFEINRSMLAEGEINSTMISFRVNKTWVRENDINLTAVRLNRFNSSWQQLNTSLVDERLTYYVYEAESPGFSVFAVTGPANVYPEPEPYCVQNATRCFGDFLQKCDGEDWIPQEKCPYGCLGGSCAEPYRYQILEGIRVVISAIAVVAVFLIFKYRRKLSSHRRMDSEALFERVGMQQIMKQINQPKAKSNDDSLRARRRRA